jgi:clan AA aspartic protease
VVHPAFCREEVVAERAPTAAFAVLGASSVDALHYRRLEHFDFANLELRKMVREGGVGMESETMGRVLVEATVENLKDLWEAESGYRSEEAVRRVVIGDALADTGATTLSLPTRLIRELGLSERGEKRVITSAGENQATMYEAVRLTIQGRDCTVDVMEVPDVVPPLIGQVPLELLDYVIDPAGQRLIGNPAHGGEHVVELL